MTTTKLRAISDVPPAPPSPTRRCGVHTLAAVVGLTWSAVVASGCATPAAVDDAATSPVTPTVSVPPAIGISLLASPELDEAAALLCARDTDNVIDGDVRMATGLVDGQVAALLLRETDGPMLPRLQSRAPLLVNETRATHAGYAIGVTPEGVPCSALVVVKRVVILESSLAARPADFAPFPFLALSDATSAVLYLTRPNGLVERRPLVPVDGKIQDVIVPGPLNGRHVLELIVDSGDDNPEVALLFPFVIGESRGYPIPEVMFPDEGHDDIALTHRLESLVLRLRNEQELDVLMLSPVLSDVASARARVIAATGQLNHRAPDGRSIGDDLKQKGDTAFVRLFEVQAQGETLRDAWRALTNSPGHRYALLDEGMTHTGGAVVQSRDALGRKLVSVVVILARRASQRAAKELRTELLGRLNLARHLRGLPVLTRHAELDALAESHVRAMAASGVVDARTDDGTTVAETAVDSFDLASAQSVVAALDDPLRLLPSRATLDESANTAGIGIFFDEKSGRFMVAVIVAREDVSSSKSP